MLRWGCWGAPACPSAVIWMRKGGPVGLPMARLPLLQRSNREPLFCQGPF